MKDWDEMSLSEQEDFRAAIEEHRRRNAAGLIPPMSPEARERCRLLAAAACDLLGRPGQGESTESFTARLKCVLRDVPALLQRRDQLKCESRLAQPRHLHSIQGSLSGPENEGLSDTVKRGRARVERRLPAPQDDGPQAA